MIPVRATEVLRAIQGAEVWMIGTEIPAQSCCHTTRHLPPASRGKLTVLLGKLLYPGTAARDESA